MDHRKIRNLRRQLESLRKKGEISSREMEKFAGQVGRKNLNQRGKEPSYMNEYLPNSLPLSIPHHSKPLKKGTAHNILDILEQDIDELEAKLPNQLGGNGHA